ncbi:MAG: hypothetical protein GW762_01935 [Candidatus Pacebacteria bacterium]|nr:hypothetical protein [Candidatus Paceibacterota bacterium]PIR63442.1 MAG: hypothetical protein COU64_04565 [Candidatus Pacebacteria bacterium CG10_big_fil_rev_8_21_14_0_10_40_26]PIZ79581.1 MAG: hypothetical protein COY01_00470 [Candidatus Pacebacteria bacterium CG_4_10_14_0_2_um_filter_40_20]PJA69034.1 MAG: hypothetical protein CO156_01720 [Candidatus Pacebacteria bacterium CG_4_9_14_3_um_filter_40_12]PJC41833.1 MAG: hypothetical protein CO041_03885 [Candidatus Pacebacteria bacterium CG_4_9_
MQEQERQPSLPFFMTEPIAAQQAKQDLLTVAAQQNETQIIEAATRFVTELQAEAEQKWPSASERDVWFFYQLTKTYIQAGLWDAAVEAVNDLQMLAANTTLGPADYNSLEDFIMQKTTEV